MKFVLVKEVNGVEEVSTVEANSPEEAMQVGSFEDFTSGRIEDNDIATVGIYEVGGTYNHLIAINRLGEMGHWANTRIEELKEKIRELTGDYDD